MEINFNPASGENFLREDLAAGRFFILIELNTPEKTSDLGLGVSHLREMASAITQVKSIPVGLALTDRLLAPEAWNVAEFADELPAAGRGRHALFISGRNAELGEVEETLDRCRAGGFPNLVAVSGNGVQDSLKQNFKMPFCDSIHTLNRIRSRGDGFFPGASLNPFKYSPGSIFLQYYKMMKKVNQGANFFITQLGWDMLKLQEARWYLEHRSLHLPTLARLLILTPEKVEDIAAGKMPGVVLSDDFRAALEQESRFGYQQFASAQWRRLQLQVAGCRLLGYSGIVLSGLERPEHVTTACGKIAEALDEFANFAVWRKAHQQHLARVEMAPYPHRFYLFKDLFSCVYPERVELQPCKIPACRSGEKIRYLLSRRILSQAHRHTAEERFLSKKILAGCRQCGWCRLPLMQYVCPETCPKGLANGACGGSRPDGRCELMERECIHGRKLRYANWRKELDVMEERFIRPVE